MKLAAPAALACAALWLSDRAADACSCMQPPPPCQAYWRVPAVFVGEVQSVSTASDLVVTTTFAVEELFKGPFTSGTASLTGGGMCSASFVVGQKYFVYAFESDGDWHASLCGRTRPLDRAAEDLAYAKNLPRRSLAELRGTVTLIDEQERRAPRAGATVAVKGTTLTGKTDASGRYTIQVPPGTHTLEVIDPGTLMLERSHEVEVPDPAACASLDIALRYDGRIRGRIIDHAGQPAANVTVWARRAAPAEDSAAVSAVTDARGAYELHGVQAGEHLVAVNPPDRGGPDPSSPIPATYYPGVASPAAAKRLPMARSGVLAGVDFALPRPLPIYTVSGVVRRKGKPGAPGAPVAAARVWLHTETPASYTRLTSVDTAADGRFSFRELAGARIKLEVCPPTAGPDSRACRALRRTLTADWPIDLDYPAAASP